jgi:DNA polymerase I-like protein with 3'-5' exonuclease and polymerase domains
MSKFVSLDFETDGLDVVRGEGKVHCFALYNDEIQEVWEWTEEGKERLRRLIDDAYIFVCHSAQFDISIVNNYLPGIELTHEQFRCTMVLQHLVNPQLQSYSLDAITGTKINYGELMKSVGLWDGKNKGELFKIPFNEYMARYNLQDTKSTWELWKSLQPHLEKDVKLKKTYEQVSNPFVEVIMSMHKGMFVDALAMLELSGNILEEVRAKTEDFLKEYPIIPKLSWDSKSQQWKLNGKKDAPNLGSPADVTALLYLNGWQPTEFKRDTGRPITDKAMLTRLYSNPDTKPELKEVARAIAEIKSLSGIESQCESILKILTYSSGRGRMLYAGWHQTGTKTHRLSSSSPNMQNLSTNHPVFGKQVRACFKPPTGYSMLIGDLSQVELAVLAYYLELIVDDSDMAQAVRDKKDIHSANTVNWTGVKEDEEGFSALRKKSKNGIFATNYGASAERLSLTLNISVTEAREIILNVEDSIPIKELKKIFWEMVASERESIEPVPHYSRRTKKGFFYDALGARHFSPDIVSSVRAKKSAAERQSFNCLLQGSVATIFMKLCYSVLVGIRPLGGWVASTVHDECILIVPEENSRKALEIANTAFNSLVLPTKQGGVPIRADFHIVSNWSEK